jgi:hypothetical protein
MADLEVWEKFAADPAVKARHWRRHDKEEQKVGARRLSSLIKLSN